MSSSTILVVGGTSGLGLELAKQLSAKFEVIITGSGKHKPVGLDVRECELTGGPELGPNIQKLVDGLPAVDLMVYAAGFAQMGTVTELDDGDIGKMANVGLVAPVLLVRDLLRKQGKIPQIIFISSTSAFTPRLKEPMYTAVKAGMGMFAQSLSLDERVGQVLVAAPGGMKTAFWDESDTDTSGFLDPADVAKKILAHAEGNYKYRLLKIPRDTGKPEIADEA